MVLVHKCYCRVEYHLTSNVTAGGQSKNIEMKPVFVHCISNILNWKRNALTSQKLAQNEFSGTRAWMRGMHQVSIQSSLI
jgi:hypothetical protein